MDRVLNSTSHKKRSSFDNRFNFKPATENEINIMTLHKSKDLGYKCVCLMDLYKWILPPEGDWVSEEDYIQALNLHYVGVTRAIEACYIMIGDKRYRERQQDFIIAQESPFLYLNNTSNLRKDLIWIKIGETFMSILAYSIALLQLIIILWMHKNKILLSYLTNNNFEQSNANFSSIIKNQHSLFYLIKIYSKPTLAKKIQQK